MILASGIIAGLIAGFLRARWNKRKLKPVNLKYEWLVLVAFLPQLLAFQVPFVRNSLPDLWVKAALISSQALLIAFAWFNRKSPGFWALGLGLFLNFLAIVSNGGLMPTNPEAVQKYVPSSAGIWEVGKRLGATKDIVLQVSETRFWWLTDRFTLPKWMNYPVVYSLGDIVIWFGAFFFFWSLGAPQLIQENTNETE